MPKLPFDVRFIELFADGFLLVPPLLIVMECLAAGGRPRRFF